MAKRSLLVGFLCLAVLPVLSAGGWSELGGGALLAATDEWGVEQLVVEADSFDFEYRGGRGPTMRIEAYGSADNRPQIVRDGALVRISLAERVRIAAAVRGRIVVYGPAMVDIEAHSGAGAILLESVVAPRLALRSSTGNISVESVEADIDLQTDAGSITVVDSAGSKRIVTDSGDISISTSSGDMFLRSAIGRINLWDVTGALDVETASGPIEIMGLSLREHGRVESRSGRIEVIFAHDLDQLSFDVSSDSGTIQIGEEVWDAGQSVRYQPGDDLPDSAAQRIPFTGKSGSSNQLYR